MNTLYFTYALEVEKTSSISQAAENLYMTQPTLSKAIKDLENSLGISVFYRTAKGVFPTPKGKEFLDYARKIVAQLQEMGLALQENDTDSQIFRLAIPRSSNISQALTRFVCSLDTSKEIKLDIRETGFHNILHLVAEGNFVLGILRFPIENSEYCLKKLTDYHLQYEELWQTRDMALMSGNHPLAQKAELMTADFKPYIEIILGDDLPDYDIGDGHQESGDSPRGKRIIVYDCATQFDLLRTNSLTYMWSPPLSQKLLENIGLVQCSCFDSREYRNLLISRSGYHYTKLDQAFIRELRHQMKAIEYNSMQ